MMPRPLPSLLVAILSLATLFAPPLRAEKDLPPNFILILADDLGWADLPTYGNTFHETPALDRLAAEGMRFTQFYAAAVCSPTRSNIQSGQNEARFGITQHIPGHKRPFAKLVDPPVPLQLPANVETIADRLGAEGYATGYFGKWHLGGKGFGPGDRGWQTSLEWSRNEVPPAVSGSPEVRRTAEFLTEKAVEFIAENRDRPFVLQVSHFAVHIPLSTTPELLEKYREKEPMPGFPSLPEYAGLLEELDQSVGGIVEAVDRAGIGERTLVIFVSDNGGLVHDQPGNIYTSNKPLREEKGTIYEGGIRVPAILRWPGTVPAGSVSETQAITTDFFPTFVELAGVDAPRDQPFDGVSLVPVLRDPGADLSRKALHWHLPHYHHSTPASAIRRGDWKLIHVYEEDRDYLYDLATDIGESNDLAEAEPLVAAGLRAELNGWLDEVNARIPVPNPNYDPERAMELDRSGRNRGKGRKAASPKR